LNSRDNARMRTAPAHISIKRFYDFAHRGIRIAFQQACGGHDHSRCAVRALHGFFREKRFLQRMQVPVLG
jgi:hypothetical protein